MYKKFLIPAFIISLISNCVLGYYLHTALFDLKCSEEIVRVLNKEVKKLNEQIDALGEEISKLLTEKYQIIEEPPKKKPVKRVDLSPLDDLARYTEEEKQRNKIKELENRVDVIESEKNYNDSWNK